MRKKVVPETGRKTVRLYTGLDETTGEPLYITLKVRNAVKPVTLNGTVEDAMRGKPGLSIGCHLSETAKANKDAFGFRVYYVSFTKSVALAITKIRNGQFSECVRYKHNYGKFVDLNDKDPSKAFVKAHPKLFNRQFTLLPYKVQENHWKPEYGRPETGERAKDKAMRGELARLRKAGLLNVGS